MEWQRLGGFKPHVVPGTPYLSSLVTVQSPRGTSFALDKLGITKGVRNRKTTFFHQSARTRFLTPYLCSKVAGSSGDTILSFSDLGMASPDRP